MQILGFSWKIHTDESVFELTISIDTSKILVTLQAGKAYVTPNISLEKKSREDIDSFVYLRSILRTNGTVDAEINHKIANFIIAFRKLKIRVRSDLGIAWNTKVEPYVQL